ncbi:hypothetical protein R1flu_006185 [Riccia fluitans]|uniref:Uncharacterized protein n=1 Tax=Riccia fluitans TaxID=41844 RepID=A0ABD1YVB4_9MARC
MSLLTQLGSPRLICLLHAPTHSLPTHALRGTRMHGMITCCPSHVPTASGASSQHLPDAVVLVVSYSAMSDSPVPHPVIMVSPLRWHSHVVGMSAERPCQRSASVVPYPVLVRPIRV